ncbi:MAG: CoA-binding protein [Saprospiraceae bacterium]
MKKKTVVLGATTNPTRYAYTAVNTLVRGGHETVPIGIKKGEVAGIEIINDTPDVEGVDTVTLYLGPDRQKEYYHYILSLKPKRIIFNPGTENPELVKLAEEQGIETVFGCTLVMLSIGNY